VSDLVVDMEREVFLLTDELTATTAESAVAAAPVRVARTGS